MISVELNCGFQNLFRFLAHFFPVCCCVASVFCCMGRKKNRSKAKPLHLKTISVEVDGVFFRTPWCRCDAHPKHVDFFLPFPPEYRPSLAQPPSLADMRKIFEHAQKGAIGGMNLSDDDASKVLSEENAKAVELDVTRKLSKLKAQARAKEHFCSMEPLRHFEYAEDVFLVMEALEGFPQLSFQELSFKEIWARGTAILFTQPMQFLLVSPTGVMAQMVVFDRTYFTVAIRPPPGASKKQCANKAVLRIFQSASSSGTARDRANTLLLLFHNAESAAYSLKKPEQFAEALDKHISGIETEQSVSMLLSLELVHWCCACVVAYLAASLDPEHSKEPVNRLRHCAVTMCKKAVARFVIHRAMFPPHTAGTLWFMLGTTLEFVGDYEMAARAYHWGLSFCHPGTDCRDDEDRRAHVGWTFKLRQGLENLSQIARMTTEERERHTVQAVSHFVVEARNGQEKNPMGPHVCVVCGVVGRSSCSACRAVHYCSAACQRTHWKEHKKHCVRRRAAAAASTNEAASVEAATYEVSVHEEEPEELAL